MDYLKELGSLALASRMKRIVDMFRSEVKSLYEEQKVNFEPSLMPLMKLLEKERKVEVNQAAQSIGISQPAVTQFSNRLLQRGLVNIDPGRDLRKREISLTKAGKEELRKLKKIWKSMSRAVDEMLSSSDKDLMKALEHLEKEMHGESFKTRVERLHKSPEIEVEIIDYDDALAADFKALNLEWIEKYFEVEDSDEYRLSNPREAIIETGGFIYFAKHQGEVIGTAALLKIKEGVFELTKMAVAERYQKKGIGRILLTQVIDKARASNIEKLVLFSNTQLAPAINMYFEEGFRVIPKVDHHNERANIKMQLKLG